MISSQCFLHTPATTMMSPFAMMSCMDTGDFVMFDYDPELEARKSYVRKMAYMPPLNNYRSLPIAYKKRLDSYQISHTGGLLFGKKRCVSFNDRVEKFEYSY